MTNSDRNNKMNYGNQKIDGSHDHRSDKKGDRTPAQKAGDAQSAETRRNKNR